MFQQSRQTTCVALKAILRCRNAVLAAESRADPRIVACLYSACPRRCGFFVERFRHQQQKGQEVVIRSHATRMQANCDSTADRIPFSLLLSTSFRFIQTSIVFSVRRRTQKLHVSLRKRPFRARTNADTSSGVLSPGTKWIKLLSFIFEVFTSVVGSAAHSSYSCENGITFHHLVKGHRKSSSFFSRLK